MELWPKKQWQAFLQTLSEGGDVCSPNSSLAGLRKVVLVNPNIASGSFEQAFSKKKGEKKLPNSSCQCFQGFGVVSLSDTSDNPETRGCTW